jgi:hypothetical protein
MTQSSNKAVPLILEFYFLAPFPLAINDGLHVERSALHNFYEVSLNLKSFVIRLPSICSA